MTPEWLLQAVRAVVNVRSYGRRDLEEVTKKSLFIIEAARI